MFSFNLAVGCDECISPAEKPSSIVRPTFEEEWMTAESDGMQQVPFCISVPIFGVLNSSPQSVQLTENPKKRTAIEVI